MSNNKNNNKDAKTNSATATTEAVVSETAIPTVTGTTPAPVVTPTLSKGQLARKYLLENPKEAAGSMNGAYNRYVKLHPEGTPEWMSKGVFRKEHLTIKDDGSNAEIVALINQFQQETAEALKAKALAEEGRRVDLEKKKAERKEEKNLAAAAKLKKAEERAASQKEKLEAVKASTEMKLAKLSGIEVPA
jgi:hypothetical protein